MLGNDEQHARGAVVAATVASGAMIAQQVAGKATRDAMFLAQFGVSSLPKMMTLGAVLSFGAALLAARALARYGPRLATRFAFATSAVVFAVEFALSFVSRAGTAVAVYVHMAVFGATTISIFWSMINERFDPHTAKKVVARIAGGGTLGGVIGGLIGWQMSHVTSVRVMLAMLALLNTVSLILIVRVGGSRRASAHSVTPNAEAQNGWQVLRRVPYLRDLALLVAIVAAVEAMIDFVFSAEAAVRLPSGAQLMSFFSLFHMLTGIATFLFQTTLARRVLEKLGIAGTIATLPLTVLVCSALNLQVPRLWSAVMLRGGETVLSNSFYRAGYELLFTPVAQQNKRPTKTIIDVGFDRLGTVVGSGLVMAALAWFDIPRDMIVIGTIFFALVALFVARRLHRGYVLALEESLVSGAVSVEAREIVDATTRRAVSTTNAVLDRRQLEREILAREARAQVEPDQAQRPSIDALLSAIIDLRSGDRLRIQRVLCTEEDDPRLLPFIVPLLASDVGRTEAMATLRRLAPRTVGALVDVLLDESGRSEVRRRIPRVLRAVPTQRAANGLIWGLEDDRFEVRYECGVALIRMLEKNPKLVVPREQVIAAVLREIAVERKLWEAEPFLDLPDEEGDAPFFDALLRDRASRSLEHVFTVLALILEREPLRIAYRALHADDPGLRGTAVEYLDNVLPPEVKELLWPFIDASERERDERGRREVMRALLESTP